MFVGENYFCRNEDAFNMILILLTVKIKLRLLRKFIRLLTVIIYKHS